MSTTDVLRLRSTFRRDAPSTAVNRRAIPTEALVLGAIVIVAIVIRILTINNQSIWTDEALTTYETHLSFGGMLRTVIDFETTPPLYFVLIWGWAKVFGSGAIALRAFSTICGVLMVPLAYVVSRELFSRWAGVLAAAFVAVNPLMVWYSQEARSYMLLALLTAAGFLWFIRAYRDLSRRNLVMWTGFAALAVMTHFFAGFIVAPEAALLLWRWRTRWGVAAIGLVAAVQLAMIPFAVADTTHGTAWIHGIPRSMRVWQAVVEWGAGTLYRRASGLEGFIAGALVCAVVIALVRFGGDRELRRRVALPAAIVVFVLLAPLLLGLLGPDFFLSRNVIPAFVPLAAIVAAACLAPRTRVLGAAFGVALLVVFSVATVRVQTNGYLQRPKWRDVATALGPAATPRAVIAADSTTADPLKLYLPHVSWVQNQSLPRRIQEVDIVGVRNKRFARPLIIRGGSLPGRPSRLAPRGDPVPREIAPFGSRLVARFKVDNWVIGRYVFPHPITVTIKQLLTQLPSYFRNVPRSVLVFVQQPR